MAPSIGCAVFGAVSRLCETRLEDIGLKDIPARLASLLLQLAESEGIMTREGPMIPTRYTQRQLATMIGSSRESVTRAFTKLQKAGAVELRRRHVYVKDVKALEQAAS